jgi:hypothetical protein
VRRGSPHGYTVPTGVLGGLVRSWIEALYPALQVFVEFTVWVVLSL